MQDSIAYEWACHQNGARERKTVEIPPGFESVRRECHEWLLRSDLRDSLTILMDGIAAGQTGTLIDGGRGGAYAVQLEGLTAIVRPYRRGGLPGRVLRDTYCQVGGPPRPFRELQVIEALRQRGVPTVEPLAAAVHWIGWRRYRGWLVTRAIDGAQSLWHILKDHPNPTVREAALRASATAIARLHAIGATHPDLNFNNILVRGDEAWLIDFDRGREQATHPQQQRALARLRRSARKLDPSGRVISDADLAAFNSFVERR